MSTMTTDEAIASSAAGVTQEWKDDAYTAIELVAHAQPTLATPDIWALIEPPASGTARALGHVMRLAARAGLIERTGEAMRFDPSEVEGLTGHAQFCSVWRSLVHEAAA